MSEVRAVMAGSGIGIPPNCVDNHMLARVLETNDAWIVERSGIHTRYYVDEGQATSDLAVQASRNALSDAGLTAGDLDYVVCATMTPDHYLPGIGSQVQHKLGLSALPCLDLRQQCAGFAYGLQVVDALIRSGVARTVLLVGAEVHSCLMPYSKSTWEVLYDSEGKELSREDFEWNSRFRHLLILFGDGAGAMVFKSSPASLDRGILGSRLYADGENLEILHMPGGGSKNRPWVTHEAISEATTVPVMEGRQVFRHAVGRMPEVTLQVLADRNFSLDDLDLLVMHQANLRINEGVQKKLGLPSEQVHNNIQKYGNTTAATLPICFHEAREEGKAPEGSLVAFTALGAGMHWGSVLMRV